METEVPRVNSWNTVLEACRLINKERASAALVVEGDKVVGMFGERGLLRRFVLLNKKPDEVRVGELMVPILHIDPEASRKTAAKKLVESGFTRLGVFKTDKFLGWVTLGDLARAESKEGLLDMLRVHDEPDEIEVLCPHCGKGILEKIVSREGAIMNWKCPKYGYAL